MQSSAENVKHNDVRVNLMKDLVSDYKENEKKIQFFNHLNLIPKSIAIENELLLKSANKITPLPHTCYSLHNLRCPHKTSTQLDIPLCSDYYREVIKHSSQNNACCDLESKPDLCGTQFEMRNLRRSVREVKIIDYNERCCLSSQHMRPTTCFILNNTHRKERMRTVLSGFIDQQSRNLKRQMKRCYVSMERLSSSYVSAYISGRHCTVDVSISIEEFSRHVRQPCVKVTPLSSLSLKSCYVSLASSALSSSSSSNDPVIAQCSLTSPRVLLETLSLHDEDDTQSVTSLSKSSTLSCSIEIDDI